MGWVPKLHALVHVRADLDDSTERNQVATLSPSCFDNSRSEDFVGKIANTKVCGGSRVMVCVYLEDLGGSCVIQRLNYVLAASLPIQNTSVK